MKQTGWYYAIKYVDDETRGILSPMYDMREECSNACTEKVNELLAEDKIKKVLSSGVFPVTSISPLRDYKYAVHFSDGAEYKSGVFDKADDLYDNLHGNMRRLWVNMNSSVIGVELW